ncbi:hypothetical protein LX32DRAFT_38346 [Colletotrichum zoysiae]|uniref:Secreted protein n=1 Tax=Colletotrichum zoysiae TaxID=1216348 RepID=A0AAD9HCX4_9PEZI|nr:hypothetical protein LX32DRAFT_38346 [Colletotrichum zoysiae]
MFLLFPFFLRVFLLRRPGLAWPGCACHGKRAKRNGADTDTRPLPHTYTHTHLAACVGTLRTAMIPSIRAGETQTLPNEKPAENRVGSRCRLYLVAIITLIHHCFQHARRWPLPRG